MRKILILIPSLTGVGGAEKLVDSLSTLLASSHQVFQASFDAEDARRHFENQTPFFPLGAVPRLPLYLRWITYAVLAFRLAQLKKKLGIDITISNLWGADLISAISLGKDKKISLGLINILNNKTNSLMIRFRSLVGIIYRRFDRILAISRPLQEELGKLYTIPDRKLGTFRNFLNTPKPDPVWGDDNVRRFVFCGRLVYEKNVDGLLTIWAEFARTHTNVQLIILGDGPLAQESQSLAHRLNLSIGFDLSDTQASVLFLGTVAHPENYMVGARAFLLTSRHEGVPTVLLLAASLCLPVLAADCHSGGVRDLLGESAQEAVKDGASVCAGMLLPIPDSSAPETILVWKRALEIVDTDMALREQWSKGAAALSVKYSVESVRKDGMAEIEALYHLS
jgi:glycosyltransferase involved in cell wall biosynthesis